VPGGAADSPSLIRGVVVDGAGRTVADARVALAAAPVPVPDIAALAEEDGSFALAVPVAGVYRVTANGEQGRAEETVTVDPGHTPRVRLVLRP
jgi:hypothetical protein